MAFITYLVFCHYNVCVLCKNSGSQRGLKIRYYSLKIRYYSYNKELISNAF